MKRIYAIIRQMGVTGKYNGYYYVVAAVDIELKNPDRPLRITKEIYPALAKKFRVSTHTVEHGIRTVVNVCWNSNRCMMDKIAGYELLYKPTNSDFIDMLAFHLGKEADHF